MTNPLISILINCYNSEKFIFEAIQSAINQTYENIEIIIWDNASTDNTSNIIKKFNSSKIKYYKNNIHTTLGIARIKACSFLNGEYVAILDSDDIAYKTRIADQYEFFIKNPDISLIGGWVNIINSKSKVISNFIPHFNNLSLDDTVLWTNPLTHSSIMYKKKIAKQIGWYSDKFINFQDYALTLKFKSVGRIGILKKIVSARRIHENNSINKKETFVKQIYEYELLLRYARRLVKNKNKLILLLNKNSILQNKLKLLLFQFYNNKKFINLIILIKFLLNNFIKLFFYTILKKFYYK